MNEHLIDSAFSDGLANVIARWAPVGRSGLLPALIESQEQLGWLSEETLTKIAQGLNVPLAQVYGVADFYAHLYTRPVGKKIVRVCDDVPCYLAGSEHICKSIEKHLGVRPGETTPDGAYTLEIVPCLGHCDHAPVMMVGNQIHEDVTEEKIKRIMSQ